MSLKRDSGAGCSCTVASDKATSSFASISGSSATALTGAGTDVEQLACSYSFNNWYRRSETRSLQSKLFKKFSQPM